MRELWDRYGPWLMIAVVTAGFLRVVWGRESFCGPETEQCFREWVSALGGWAAVAAAVPTVFYLARQIREAQDQHKYHIWASKQPAIALTRAVEVQCSKIIGLIMVYKESKSTSKSHKDHLLSMQFTSDQLSRSISLDLFLRFELEIGHPESLDSAFIRSMLFDMNKMISDEKERTPPDLALIDSAQRIFEDQSIKLLTKYVEEVRAVITDFRAEVERIRL